MAVHKPSPPEDPYVVKYTAFSPLTAQGNQNVKNFEFMLLKTWIILPMMHKNLQNFFYTKSPPSPPWASRN